ncbi:nuclear transcription factor Y subunit B-1-like protein [Carex littledalei]|uniref:Nuclear transcription factor Y subunit B-1-like protein n=1 Tax=Carex littledalei TaxID=544730 RepID=A0A833QHI3_9POAL|nr:nuclear transcription factor Y subunit B-1-like protein [Carex littledalei]
MKKILPPNAKISKESKDRDDAREASDKGQKEKRKTVNGELETIFVGLLTVNTLGLDDYVELMRRTKRTINKCHHPRGQSLLNNSIGYG